MAIAVTTGAVAKAAQTSVTPVLPAHATDNTILVFAYQRATTTALTISGTGWNQIASTTSGTYGGIAAWWKNATSNAEPNPTVTGSSTSNLSITAVALVLTGTDSDTPIDVAAGTPSVFSAPLTPFDVTANGVVTNSNEARVFAMFGSMDNNDWAVQTAGWDSHVSGTTGSTTLGSDCSIGIFSKEQPLVGSSGDVVARQTNVAGDSGTYMVFAIAQATHSTVAGTLVAGAGSVFAPSIRASTIVSPGVTATSSAVPAHAASAGSTTLTGTVNGQATLFGSTVTFGATAVPTLTAASATVQQPQDVLTGSSIFVDLLSTVSQVPDASVTTGGQEQNIAAELVLGSTLVYLPTPQALHLPAVLVTVRHIF